MYYENEEEEYEQDEYIEQQSPRKNINQYPNSRFNDS